MKKLFLIIFCFFVLQKIHSQVYKDKVRSQFMEYTNLIMSRQFDKSLEFTNPGFLSLVPKDQMIKLMEATYNNPDFEFAIENPIVMGVSDSQIIVKESFAKVKYSSTIRMRFIQSQKDSVSAEDQLERSQLIKAALEKQFGTGNVKFDSTTRFYEIYAIKNVIANSKDGEKWTFVVVEDKYKPILEKFIPKQILDDR